MGRACSTNRKNTNADRLLVGKSERKRPLGWPRRKWVVNIKMDLGESMGCMDWVYLVQVRDWWGGRSCERGNDILEFHKMLGSSWVAAQLAASLEARSFMEFSLSVMSSSLRTCRTTSDVSLCFSKCPAETSRSFCTLQCPLTPQLFKD
jgi:hypothetical protein